MADNGSEKGIDRRKFIGGIGAGVAAGLAGCGGGGGPATEPGTEPAETTTGGQGGTTETDTATPTATEAQEIIRGGEPISATTEDFQHLNILKTGPGGSVDGFVWLYTRGTKPHPTNGKPIPWGYTDWELMPENVGSGDPTIVATMRDDLVFSDGKKVTAEDAAFTYNYMIEQQTGGEPPRKEVEEVTMDKPKGTTVNFFLNAETATWNSQILNHPFLPKHVWKDVSNYNKFAPRKEKNGLVASGPVEAGNMDFPNWVEYPMRDDDVIPWNEDDRYPWLHPEGPFIDTWRVELFEDRASLFQAILDGNIHMPFDTVTVSQGVKAQQHEDVSVKKALDSDYTYHSFNTRRVPLDDPAFRQFLSKALNRNWLVERNYKGIAAQKNFYITSTMYDEWRPPEPGQLKKQASDPTPYDIGTYQGITMPDLTWPSDSLEYGETVRQEDVKSLREFLLNHPDAKHDYTLEAATSDPVKSRDKKEIFVNGKPLPKAHTNNAGKPGQGPIEMSMNGPQDDPLAFSRQNQWVTVLNRIGVPTERNVMTWQSQIPKVYINENWDVIERDWGNGLVWPQTHIQYWHSRAADLKKGPEYGTEDDDILQLNPMAYTNADELIDQALGMMNHEKRKPIVKKLYAKVYRDSPTMPAATFVNLLPAHKEFTGYVSSNVDLLNRSVDTPLNIRLNPAYQ